jgi:outer membrane lipoprotein SlyB
MNNSTTAPITSTTSAGGLPRWMLLAGGAGLLVIGGLASALVFSNRAPVAEPAATVAMAGSGKTPMAPEDGVRPVVRQAAQPVAKPAPVACNSCGVVDSVVAVQRKGEGSGAGAVVGGVLGGVVGNQMGGGSGKTAMTVLGAIGGGVAGNEVEKRAKAETVYQVRVRMDDGSKRTVTLGSAAFKSGDRVAVDGDNLRAIN